MQNAFADVENALSSREKLGEQLAAQTRLLAASKNYERLATLQYNGGYAPYSTVLQAQQQLFPAELQWAQLSSSALSAAVTVYQAMGGGWVDEADRMTAAAPAERLIMRQGSERGAGKSGCAEKSAVAEGYKSFIAKGEGLLVHRFGSSQAASFFIHIFHSDF